MADTGLMFSLLCRWFDMGVFSLLILCTIVDRHNGNTTATATVLLEFLRVISRARAREK